MAQAPKPIEILGTFKCRCCCDGESREYTDDACDIGYMRCDTCRCTKVRMGSATQIALRVQVVGALSIKAITEAAELASVLGAPDDIVLTRADSNVHFFEVDARGALSRLEFNKLTGRRADARGH
jgi:hypothetical protein